MKKRDRPATKTVRSRSRKGATAKLAFDDGTVLEARPFVPVGEGDEVVLGPRSMKVVIECGKSAITVSPVWRTTKRIRIGRTLVTLTIKEVESVAELDGLTRLQRFHYRHAAGIGRVVPLIATVESPLLPDVIGFVEITSALLVNTARKKLLDRAFSDPNSGISWKRWDMATASAMTRRIARISRCVVYPEIRGLGLSRILAEAATEFARERWHFGGARPLFLEITADMLRYIPFVKNAGFTFIGNTEGNEDRVLKDMRYLLGRNLRSKTGADLPKGGGGIMALQRSYATTLQEVMKSKKLGLESLLNLLRRDPSSLTDEEWVALHRVFRRPKPTYMIGLTPRANDYVKAFAPRARNMRTSHSLGPKQISPQLALSVCGLGLSTLARPSSSARARKVAEAFGVVSKDVSTALISELDLCVIAGEILLVTGPSGSGKSLLLKALSHIVKSKQTIIAEMPDVRVEVKNVVGQPKIAWLEARRTDSSAVDLLENLSIEDALTTLAAAGLGEAPLFVKPTNHFSDGQLYRLGLAVALSKRPDILMADAFCEPLDQFSAATVCARMREYCKANNIAVIVATADPDRVIPILKPDKVLHILPGRTHYLTAENERHT